jgi:hypothetical protein
MTPALLTLAAIVASSATTYIAVLAVQRRSRELGVGRR